MKQFKWRLPKTFSAPEYIEEKERDTVKEEKDRSEIMGAGVKRTQAHCYVKRRQTKYTNHKVNNIMKSGDPAFNIQT